jgi:hypothetical protein
MPGSRDASSNDTTPCEEDRRDNNDNNSEGTPGLARPHATTTADS